MSEESSDLSIVDLLIVTVNKHETKAVLEAFSKAISLESYPQTVDKRVYQNLGELNGAHVWLVESRMGGAGTGASLQTVERAVRSLKPAAVLMVGIAFGVEESKQNIGDILVAEQLALYELQRVSEQEIIPRGDVPSCSDALWNYISSAELRWQGAPVQQGILLSGEKLIDNLDYRERLRKLFPEAIGGEMEGGGLYAACKNADFKVEWALVKAICDWADGNKDQDKNERQKLAAKNAAEFVVHMLQHAEFPLMKKGRKKESEAGFGVGQDVSERKESVSGQDNDSVFIRHTPIDCSRICGEVGKVLDRDELRDFVAFLKREGAAEETVSSILCTPPPDEAISRLNRALQGFLDARRGTRCFGFRDAMEQLAGWLALRAVDPGKLEPVIQGLVVGEIARAMVEIRDNVGVEIIVSFAQGREPEFATGAGSGMHGRKWVDTRLRKPDMGPEPQLEEQMTMIYDQVLRKQRNFPRDLPPDKVEVGALESHMKAAVDDREGAYYATGSLIGLKADEQGRVDQRCRQLQGRLRYLKIVLTGGTAGAGDLVPSSNALASHITNLYQKLERIDGRKHE